MIAPHDPLAWLLVAVAGAVVGRLVIAVVAPLVAVDATGRPVPPDAGFGRGFQAAAGVPERIDRTRRAAAGTD